MSKIDVSEMKGPLGELVDQLSGENASEVLASLNLWLKKVTVKILKHLHDVSLGPIAHFSAAEKFTKSNSKVKFWDFGENFTNNFGNRVENNISVTIISVSRLEQRAKDPAIKAELAGETKRVFTISLAHFYAMIEAQGQGQAGPLLVKGYANIAYIDDMDIWVVVAGWDAGDGRRVPSAARARGAVGTWSCLASRSELGFLKPWSLDG